MLNVIDEFTQEALAIRIDRKLNSTEIASAYTLGGVVGPFVSGMTLHVVEGHGAILAIVALMVVYGAVLFTGVRRRH